MKTFALIVAVAAVAAGGWWFLAGTASKTATRTLNVYTWSDYFEPELVREFERAHDCRVIFDIFASNEDANIRLQNGAEGYDLVTPSSYMVSLWRKQDFLRPIDHALVPNAKKFIDPGFLQYTEDPAMSHSVPYTRTVTGVGYDVTRTGEEIEQTWAIFGDERFKGRMTMLDDPREMMAAALAYLNATKAGGEKGRYDINTADDAELAEAARQLMAWKKNLARFAVDEAKTGLEDGTYFVVQQYNGDVAQIMANNPNVRFFVPREGSSIASDDFVVLKNARQPELAHAFVNHMLDPENAARNMAGIRYYQPIPAALSELKKIDAALAENPAFNVPMESLTRCAVLRDLGDDLGKYTAAYEKVLSAQ